MQDNLSTNSNRSFEGAPTGVQCVGTLKEGIWRPLLPLEVWMTCTMYDIWHQLVWALIGSMYCCYSSTLVCCSPRVLAVKSSKRFLVSSEKTVKTKWLLKTLIVVVDQYSSLPHTKLQKVHVSTFVYHQLNHCPGCSMRRAISAHADTINYSNGPFSSSLKA